MVASVQNPADLANIALTRMGYKGARIGNLYDGSEAASNFLDLYAQTRDELLRSSDWGFAERNVALTLLKSAPVGGYFPPNVWNPTVNPPPGYLFEYAYPDDALKVRSVRRMPLFGVNFDPQPNIYSIDNDSALVPAQRVILCNVPSAILVYTGQVTNPATWDVLFCEALAASLARRTAAGLVGADMTKMEVADEQAADAAAEGIQG